MFNLTANGASVLAVQEIGNRARRLGLDNDNNNKPLVLSEQEQIRDYMIKNGREANDNNNSNKSESGLSS